MDDQTAPPPPQSPITPAVTPTPPAPVPAVSPEPVATPPVPDPAPIPPPPTAPTIQTTRRPLGVVIGIVVLLGLSALGVYAYILYTRPVRTTTVATLPSPSATPTPTTTPLFLNVSTTLGSYDGEVLVSGRTLPDTTVLIYSDTDETSVESDAGGSFEGTIMVEDDPATIKVVAIDPDGDETEMTLELAEDTQVLGESDHMTDSITVKSTRNSAVGQGVKQLVEPENGVPDIDRNSVGKDDDADDTSDDMETDDDATQSPPSKDPERREKSTAQTLRIREFTEIKTQTRTVEKRGAIEVRKLLTKEATKEARIAQEVRVKRILAREATGAAILKRHAVSGVITALGDSQITIAHLVMRDRTYTVYYNANTVITSPDAGSGAIPVLSTGLRVAVVGEPDGDDLLATRIHIIPGKATGVKVRVTPASGSGFLEASPSAIPSPPDIPDTSPTPTNIPIVTSPPVDE